MTKESDYWTGKVKPKLDKAKLIPRRIENSASAGIPDVSIGVPGKGYIWAELKVGTNKFSLKKYQYAYFISVSKQGLGHLNFIVISDYGVIDANVFAQFHTVRRTNGKDVFVDIDLDCQLDLDRWIDLIPNLFTD